MPDRAKVEPEADRARAFVVKRYKGARRLSEALERPCAGCWVWVGLEGF